MTRARRSMPASTASWSRTTAAARSIGAVATLDALPDDRRARRAAGCRSCFDDGVRRGRTRHRTRARSHRGRDRPPVRLRPRGRRRDGGARGASQSHRRARHHDRGSPGHARSASRPRRPPRHLHLAACAPRHHLLRRHLRNVRLPIATPIAGRAGGRDTPSRSSRSGVELRLGPEQRREPSAGSRVRAGARAAGSSPSAPAVPHPRQRLARRAVRPTGSTPSRPPPSCRRRRRGEELHRPVRAPIGTAHEVDRPADQLIVTVDRHPARHGLIPPRGRRPASASRRGRSARPCHRA